MNAVLARQLIVTATLLLLSLSGCKTLENRQSAIQLDKVLSSYHTAIRWGSPDRAYAFLKPELFSTESLPGGLDNVRVTGYEVVQPPLPMSEEMVKQIARISYVLKDRQIERSLIDEQIWEYQPEEKLWYRVNPIPAYR